MVHWVAAPVIPLAAVHLAAESLAAWARVLLGVSAGCSLLPIAQAWAVLVVGLLPPCAWLLAAQALLPSRKQCGATACGNDAVNAS